MKESPFISPKPSFCFCFLQTLTLCPGYLYYSLSFPKHLHALLISFYLLLLAYMTSSKGNPSGETSLTTQKVDFFSTLLHDCFVYTTTVALFTLCCDP